MGGRGLPRPGVGVSDRAVVLGPGWAAGQRVVRGVRRHRQHRGEAAVRRRAPGLSRRRQHPPAAELLFAGGAARARPEGKGTPSSRYTVTGVRPARCETRLAGVQSLGSSDGSRSWVGRAALDARPPRGGRHPLRHRGAGDRKTRLLGEVRRVFEKSPCEGGISSGSRDAASRTASRCRTGRSATCCATGSESRPTRPSYACAWLRRRTSSSSSRPGCRRIYPYLGSMLGLALEPDARHPPWPSSPRRRSVPHVRGRWSCSPRLAEDGPVVVAIEDLHWADPTSVQLTEQLLPWPSRRPCCSCSRSGRSETIRRGRSRRWPRELSPPTTELRSAPLRRGGPGAARGARRAGDAARRARAARARCRRGQPVLPRGARAATPATQARSSRRRASAWRFEHDVAVEVPQTVEKVILARIDRLPSQSRDLLVSASVLGRHFGLPLLDGVLDNADLRRRAP